MFKPATFTLLIGALGLSACIITSDDGDTSTSGTATNATNATNGDTGQTSDPSTSGAEETTAEETAAEETTAADETGSPGPCGWGATNDEVVPFGYVCGGDGEDPDGEYPMACPEGLQEGERCGALTGQGCCDDAGDVWFCWDEGGNQTLVRESCG